MRKKKLHGKLKLEREIQLLENCIKAKQWSIDLLQDKIVINQLELEQKKEILKKL